MPTKRNASQAARGSQQKPRPGRRILLLPAIGGALLLAVVLAGGGFAFAATQEQHDAFCASCHTQPETTFYQRATATQPVDLAAFHTGKDTRCINCHSGPGVTGRMSAEVLGARNAALWYSGTAVQPAKLTVPIADPNCLKCHQQVTVGRGRNNHFHAFLARWQALDPAAAQCVSCHPAHNTDGSADTGFQTEATTRAVCDACHTALGEGGED